MQMPWPRIEAAFLFFVLVFSSQSVASVGYHRHEHKQEHQEPHRHTLSVARHKVHRRLDDGTWPNLELFVRMFSGHAEDYRKIVFRSLVLFWPVEHVRLTVVLDAESEEDQALADKLYQEAYVYNFNSFRVHFERPSEYYVSGKSRMFLSMLWADNYTSADYIGFVDADTFFVSVVTPNDIFVDGWKPIVIGQIGKPLHAWWDGVPWMTEHFLTEPQVMKCMNYFPVVFHRSHLRGLREHIEKAHNRDFNFVFKELLTNHPGQQFCQFSILCSYVWYNHRDEYHFYFEELEKGWNGHVDGQLPIDTLGDIEAMKYPFPRISVHLHYHCAIEDHIDPAEEMMKSMLLEGYCYSTEFRDRACHRFLVDTSNKNTNKNVKKSRDGVVASSHPFPSTTQLHLDLFSFEGHNWTWHEKCQEAQNRHYAAVRAANHSWDHELVEYITS